MLLNWVIRILTVAVWAHLHDTTVVYDCPIWSIRFSHKSLQDQFQHSRANSKHELCFYVIIEYAKVKNRTRQSYHVDMPYSFTQLPLMTILWRAAASHSHRRPTIFYGLDFSGEHTHLSVYLNSHHFRHLLLKTYLCEENVYRPTAQFSLQEKFSTTEDFFPPILIRN